MTHEAAREALRGVDFVEKLNGNLIDPTDATIDAILSALDKHLIPDGCVAVCPHCTRTPSNGCAGYVYSPGDIQPCPLRQGEKP